jgi:hypothetical protein
MEIKELDDDNRNLTKIDYENAFGKAVDQFYKNRNKFLKKSMVDEYAIDEEEAETLEDELDAISKGNMFIEERDFNVEDIMSEALDKFPRRKFHYTKKSYKPKKKKGKIFGRNKRRK